MKRRFTSLLLTLFMLVNMVPAVHASQTASETMPTEINADTVWSYLDNGTDPAGDASTEGYERTSWTDANYDDSTWKTGKGSFGAKRGKLAPVNSYMPDTLLTQYKEDGLTNIEAFFFRTEIMIEDASQIKQILGRVLGDDSVTLYINGTKVAGFHDADITANVQYGGDDAVEEALDFTDEQTLSLLRDGRNVVAAEVHQCDEGSSDIYFEVPSLEFRKEVYVEPVALSNVSLSMGADQTKMNVTWHINADTAGKLLVAKASELVNDAMPQTAAVYPATSQRNNDGKYTNKATAAGLEAGVKYAYQAVNGEAVSEIGFFTPDDGGAFSFAYVGDPQIGSSGSTDGDASGWDNTLNLVANDSAFSDISFLLSAGDQVDTAGSESQYDGYLDHDVLKNLPVATVIGNHDSYSDSYSQHFNVANESLEYGTTDAGGDYWFVYNNVLFMVLNTNDLSAAEHKAFMESALAANPDVDWKIVTFHQSIYTVAGHYDNDGTDRRETLVPIFDELDIDVVLQGHDHVYCRTYMMKNFAVSDTDKYTYGNGDGAAPTAVTDPEGVLYITANSGSGSKHYDIVQNVEFPYSAVQNQEHIPNVSKVSVSGEQFTITTYRTTDMSVVDTFTINRTVETSGDDDGASSGDSSKPAIRPNKDNADAISFADVEEDAYYAPAVKWAVENGVTSGTGTATFSPDRACTRAQIVTFLWRAAGSPAPAGGMMPFEDIDADDYYYNAVLWAVENGITTGTSTTAFSPDQVCTRGQIAAFLWRSQASPKVENAEMTFADVSGDAYYYSAVLWAVKNGITNGTSATTFSPDQACTRGQCVTFLWETMAD